MVSPGVFSFLWLNPPYTEIDGQRAELVFLRDLYDKLVPGGLLGYCVPETVLRNFRVLGVIASRFKPAAVYRFTPKNYPVFGQVVLFAYRRRKSPPPEELKNSFFDVNNRVILLLLNGTI